MSFFPAFNKSRWFPSTVFVKGESYLLLYFWRCPHFLSSTRVGNSQAQAFYWMKIPKVWLMTPAAFFWELVLGVFKAPLIILFSGFLNVQNLISSVHGILLIFAISYHKMGRSSQLFVVSFNYLLVNFFEYGKKSRTAWRATLCLLPLFPNISTQTSWHRAVDGVSLDEKLLVRVLALDTSVYHSLRDNSSAESQSPGLTTPQNVFTVNSPFYFKPMNWWSVNSCLVLL